MWQYLHELWTGNACLINHLLIWEIRQDILRSFLNECNHVISIYFTRGTFLYSLHLECMLLKPAVQYWTRKSWFKSSTYVALK
jgi:hypothetical protein